MSVELLNVDCMDYMAGLPDKAFDLAIVDPNYGRKEHGGVNRSGNRLQKNGSKLFVKDGCYKKKQWDNNPASPMYFKELFRVTKHQIIWGCNYYTENFGSGRIVWDKCNGDSDQSDCEIAYNSLTNRVDLFRYMWSGMLQGKSVLNGHIMQGNKQLNEKRIHPTQKPVALYEWLLHNYAKPGFTILDTHAGSRSLAIACNKMSFDHVSCEIDIDYHNESIKRFKEQTAQLQLLQQ